MENNVFLQQGESFAVPVQLSQDGIALTVDMLEELEIRVGVDITRRLSNGDIYLGEDAGTYYFIPTQEETLAMKPGRYLVGVRVKYPGIPPSVNIEPIGIITILPSNFREVI